MEKTNHVPWRRLERVIEFSGLSINSFARYVGLPRGENLYQIKRGNYGISLNVARKVHAKFPQFPLSWLMYGETESPVMSVGDVSVVRIPVYKDLSVLSYPVEGDPTEELVLSVAEAGGARLAVLYAGESSETVSQDWLILLREPDDEIADGRVYLVATEYFYLFCGVYRIDDDPACLRLKSVLQTATEELVIRRENIRVLWPVCGAVYRLK